MLRRSCETSLISFRNLLLLTAPSRLTLELIIRFVLILFPNHCSDRHYYTISTDHQAVSENG